MPQMAPMSWILCFILFSTLTLITITIIYPYMPKNMPTSSLSLMKKSPLIKW